jgi:hypothetical protein
MRRLSPKVVVTAIALSLASTLSIAWACAAWISIDEKVAGRFVSVPVGGTIWDTSYVQNHFGHTRINFLRSERHYDQVTARFTRSSNQDLVIREEVRAGWPSRAFRSERDAISIIVPNQFGLIQNSTAPARSGIALGPIGHPWRVLPYDLIWPGFIANVTFYSIVWCLLLAAPSVVRGRLRIKRGQCASCGYPIGTSDTCTECGSSVKRRNIDH